MSMMVVEYIKREGKTTRRVKVLASSLVRTRVAKDDLYVVVTDKDGTIHIPCKKLLGVYA